MKFFAFLILSLLSLVTSQNAPALFDADGIFNFNLTGAYPEGIEYDGDFFYLSSTGISFATGSPVSFPDFGIIRLANDGTLEPEFIQPTQGVGVGVEIVGNDLWFATTNFTPADPQNDFRFGLTQASLADGSVTNFIDASNFPGVRTATPFNIANDVVADNNGRIWFTETIGNGVYYFDTNNGTVAQFTSSLFTNVTATLPNEFNGLNGIEYLAVANTLIIGFSGIGANAQLFTVDLSPIDANSLINCTTAGVNAPVTQFCEIDPSDVTVVPVTVDVDPSGLDGIYLTSANTLLVVGGDPINTIWEYTPDTTFTGLTLLTQTMSILPQPTTVVERSGRAFVVHANFGSTPAPVDIFSVTTFTIGQNPDTTTSSATALTAFSALISAAFLFLLF